MDDAFSQLRLDRARVGTMPSSGDSGRDLISNHSCRAKERLGRSLIVPLTEEDIH